MHLQENTVIIKPCHIKFAQYPLHHVTYTHAKFEVAKSKDLGEDTITRNFLFRARRTTDRLWYEINIPFSPYEKTGITES